MTDPKTNTLHLIGNAHIDPVWLWRWTEGYQETRATFRSALDRLAEFPQFVFTASQAAVYQWVQESEPALFAAIQQQVAAGRWATVGGWWMEPDCNLPSGESFARHSLYGQQYFQAAFGAPCRVGYCVDSFGHHAMLPQLLQQGGLDAYVFMRPNKIENPRCPEGPFWWESPDGSRVLAFRLLSGYGTGPDQINPAALGAVAAHFTDTLRHLMYFYGVGNHGGGPTIATLRSLEALQADPALPTLSFSDPARYFAALRADLPADLPVYRGELQMHAVGCYAAHAGVKTWNRRAGHLLLAAERWAVISQHLIAMPAATTALSAAWQTVLFNQFHDILAGTCIREAYDDVRGQFGAAAQAAGAVLNTALQRLASQVDTRGGEAALLVFNPHTFAAQVPVEQELMVWHHGPGASLTLTDDTGQPVVSEAAEPSAAVPATWRRQLAFVADLPPLGYRVYHLRANSPAPTAAPADSDLRLATLPSAVDNDYVIETDGRADWVLENSALRLTLDGRRGGLASLFDKRLGRELLSGPAAVGHVLDDPTDTWSHGVTAYTDVVGQFSGARLTLIENGPVRLRVRATTHYGASTLRQDFFLYRAEPSVEVRVWLDWHERLKLLKLAFPVAVTDPRATFEIPYGVLERPADGSEVPGQRWVDLSGATPAGPAGLSIVNDALYSYDVTGAQVRLTVLRSPVYAHHTPKQLEPDADYAWMDQGEHTFRYVLAPHAGPCPTAALMRQADLVNLLPITQAEGLHPGPLPPQSSFLSVDAPNVLVTVLKAAETGPGLIIRAQETAGQPTTTTLQAAFLGRADPISLGPWQVKTWRLDPAQPGLQETNFLELPVEVAAAARVADGS